MQERHSNKQKYFQEQAYTSEKYVIPFLKEVIVIDSNLNVLEIGCGECGNMIPFLDLGCKVTGVDLSCGKIENARNFLKDHPNFEKLSLFCQDIYTWDSTEKFDLIYMRDVLEHIPNQERFLSYIKKFLSPKGKVFFGFPPWQNPFGGHQQICENKWLSKMPWFHLLPRNIYKLLLERSGERKQKVETLLDVYDTRISIERFFRILKKENYKISLKRYYLFNPNYEIKFGLKVLTQPLAFIPWIRNFIVTTSYFVVELK